MQHPPPLVQETSVGHLVGEGMLEGILPLGEQARLVEELGRLEVRETTMQRVLGQLGDGLEEGKGTSVPMTAAVCSRRLSSAGSRSMRAASTACTVAGTCSVCRALPGDRRPGSPTSTWVSIRVRTLSSRKNGFPWVRTMRRL